MAITITRASVMLSSLVKLHRSIKNICFSLDEDLWHSQLIRFFLSYVDIWNKSQQCFRRNRQDSLKMNPNKPPNKQMKEHISFKYIARALRCTSGVRMLRDMKRLPSPVLLARIIWFMPSPMNKYNNREKRANCWSDLCQRSNEVDYGRLIRFAWWKRE